MKFRTFAINIVMVPLLRKIVLFTLLACMPVIFSCNRKQPRITGNLTGLADSWVWLYSYEDDAMVKTDSSFSSEGRFSIRQPKALPDIAFVNFEVMPDLFVPVFTDAKDVYISGNLTYKDDIRVSGTLENDRFQNYLKSIRNDDIMARTIDRQITEWEMDSTQMDSSGYRKLLRKREGLLRKIARSREDFVKENPSSVVSAMFLNITLNESMGLAQVDSLISRLDSTIVDNAFSNRLMMRRKKLSN